MGTKRKISVAEKLELGELTEAEAYELTREAAVNALDRAMQCRNGLEAKLLQRGYPSSTVAAVLERLISVGLLNDTEYAQALTRARLERGLAKRAIGAELARKGISAEVSTATLGQIDPVQQAESAHKIAVQAVNRCIGLPNEVKARRAFGAVSRRGFSGSVAAAAVAKALAVESADLETTG